MYSISVVFPKHFTLYWIWSIVIDMEGWTISEMSKKLGLLPRTVERRLQRAGIVPLTKEATYPKDTLDKIKDVKMGRPKKAAEPEPKAAGKAKKGKK